MRAGVSSPSPRPAGVPPSRPRRTLTFRQTLLRVALAHLFVILLIAFWRLPASKPAPGEPMEFIALPGPVAPSTAGSAPPVPEPAPAPPAPAPAPAPTPPPTPQPPQPTPPPTPEPEVAPEPTPVQPPSEIVIPPKPKVAPKPKPAKPLPKPAKPAPPQEEDDEEEAPAAPAPPAKPAPHRPKVDLTHEVTRPAPAGVAGGKGSPAARNTGAAETHGTGLQASGVANRLSQALHGSGADARVVTGPPGGGGGGGGSQGYYELIRRQMYGAWDQPVELTGQHLRAKIEIRVEKDGTVTHAALLAGSGNASFDAGVLAAARRVARIEKPRPDDVPETVVINFQLVE